MSSGFGPDDGYCYIIDEDSIVQIHRESGEITMDKEFERSWEAFPFGSEAWKGMLDWGVAYEDSTVDFLAHREDTSFRYINEEYFLLHLNGTMYICEHHKHPDGQPYIWTIFSLEEESGISSAFGVENSLQ